MKGWLSNYFNKQGEYCIVYVSFNTGKEVVYHGSSDTIFSIFCEIQAKQVEEVAANLPFDIMFFDNEEKYNKALNQTVVDFDGCNFVNVNELNKYKAHYNLYEVNNETIAIVYYEKVTHPKQNKSDYKYGMMEYFNRIEDMQDRLYKLVDNIYYTDYLPHIKTKRIKTNIKNKSYRKIV